MSNTTENSASKRIACLLDEGSFVEVGKAVTARATDFNLNPKETPADGVITGYGVIDGNLVYVYSQDASVLKGAIGEMHAKKIVNIYDMAMKMGAPVIGLVDCAGIRLQEAIDALSAFGDIYKKQTLASGMIPQIMAVFGSCGGGLTVATGLADFTFMAEDAKLFVNAPNTLSGNEVSRCDTSSANFQSEMAGTADVVGTEEEVLSGIRSLICMLPSNNEDDNSYEECQDDLNRLCVGIEAGVKDPAITLPAISDNQIFFEVKKDYAKSLVTGFIRLNGMTIGAIANRQASFDENGDVSVKYDPRISAKGCKKGTDFVNFCDAFNIPILTLTQVEGYAATKGSERSIAREAAKLTYAFANATVPKVNVVVGKSYGSAFITMNSKSLGADISFAWENAEIGMMDAELAAKIMYSDADAATLKEKSAEYKDLQSSPVSAARRGYVDALIVPESTRKYLIGAFEMLFTKREERPAKKHGTV